MAAERILLATVGRAHGVRGEVRVKTFTGDPSALADYGPLRSDDGRSFRIERLRPAKDVVVVKFAEIGDRNAAEALNGTDLWVERSALPDADEDEFYHADLIGLSAFDDNNTPLGTLIAVHDHGAGDILEIAPSRGKTMLVPFTKETVPAIDIAGGRLTIVPPPEIEAKGEEEE